MKGLRMNYDKHQKREEEHIEHIAESPRSMV